MPLFTTIDGKDYVQVHGYFSSDTKTKIPFPESHKYLVEHVVNLDSKDQENIRAYYRNTMLGSTTVTAVLTSTNVVKKVRVRVRVASG